MNIKTNTSFKAKRKNSLGSFDDVQATYFISSKNYHVKITMRVKDNGITKMNVINFKPIPENKIMEFIEKIQNDNFIIT